MLANKFNQESTSKQLCKDKESNRRAKVKSKTSFDYPCETVLKNCSIHKTVLYTTMDHIKQLEITYLTFMFFTFAFLFLFFFSSFLFLLLTLTFRSCFFLWWTWWTRVNLFTLAINKGNIIQNCSLSRCHEHTTSHKYVYLKVHVFF